MDEESVRQEKERARLERVLLWALMSLKRDDFPPALKPRFAQFRSLASRQGELTPESIRSLTDDEVAELWSVVEDLLGSPSA
jgi:hypothetical protein